MVGKKQLGCLPVLLLFLVAGALISDRDDDEPAAVYAPAIVSNPALSTRSVVDAVQISPVVRYVDADTLNVRAFPSTDGAVLLKVSRGTSVSITHRSGAWYGVSLSDGSVGWVHGDYLANAPAPQQALTSRPAPSKPDTVPSYDRNQVVQAIIDASIRAYPGNCPCPYNRMRNGRSCGGNSAFSKPGGRSPICYPEQVTSKMIERFISSR